jgi:ABC-type Fe3+ transport system permease subunit
VFVALMGAPFILPVIVAVLGLLAIFGRAGWLNAGLGGDRGGDDLDLRAARVSCWPMPS